MLEGHGEIWRAAHGEIDRKGGEGRETADQPRGNESPMPGASQRVISRRGMQERIETIADDACDVHVTSRFGSFRQKDAPERLLYLSSHRVRATLSER